MRPSRRNLIVYSAIVALSILAAPRSIAHASELRVVATLSTFADLAKQIGGSRISVSHIASPHFDPHFIEPRPTDVLKVKRADLFIHGGLDLEAWRGPLVNAAGNPKIRPGGSRELDLSIGIPLLEIPTKSLTRADGDVHIYGNPHYWLSPVNAKKIAESIAGKLSEIDPDGAGTYQGNLKSFLGAIDAKIAEWTALVKPHLGKKIVCYHKSWRYLVDFMGLVLEHYIETKPGIAPTPRHLEELLSEIQKEKISVIVQESFYPKRAAEILAQRSGAKVLLLCQNVNELEDCSDYISTIDFDIRALAGALQG